MASAALASGRHARLGGGQVGCEAPDASRRRSRRAPRAPPLPRPLRVARVPHQGPRCSRAGRCRRRRQLGARMSTISAPRAARPRPARCRRRAGCPRPGRAMLERRRRERHDVEPVHDGRTDRLVADDDRAASRPAAHLRPVGRDPQVDARPRPLRRGRARARSRRPCPPNPEMTNAVSTSASRLRSTRTPIGYVSATVSRWAIARRESCPNRPGSSRGPRRSRSAVLDLRLARLAKHALGLADQRGRGNGSARGVGRAGAQREHLGDRDGVAVEPRVAACRRRGRALTEATWAPAGRRSCHTCRCSRTPW